MNSDAERDQSASAPRDPGPPPISFLRQVLSWRDNGVWPQSEHARYLLGEEPKWQALRTSVLKGCTIEFSDGMRKALPPFAHMLDSVKPHFDRWWPELRYLCGELFGVDRVTADTISRLLGRLRSEGIDEPDPFIDQVVLHTRHFVRDRMKANDSSSGPRHAVGKTATPPKRGDNLARLIALMGEHHDWSKTRYAAELGVDRSTIYRLFKKLEQRAAQVESKKRSAARLTRGSKTDGHIEAKMDPEEDVE